MNTTYQYKTGRNNIEFASNTSKKGTFRPFVRKKPAHVEFAEKCLSFIDMILEVLCSARVIEIGTISLLTGISCLGLLVALEFVILRD